MEEQFREFLKKEGYSEYTPSGHKSTVYDYLMRVKRIMKWEDMTWEALGRNISKIMMRYDVGGEKEDIGRKSHNAYINAIRAYERFETSRRRKNAGDQHIDRG
ncbi:MAG: hypothetical protein Q4D55_05375 [Eubacteriales bacterium]|nr:hypothetical protein [Eubacteriales bacterium]